jgi:hypothetical protein
LTHPSTTDPSEHAGPVLQDRAGCFFSLPEKNLGGATNKE